jgi:hypothetical protein
MQHELPVYNWRRRTIHTYKLKYFFSYQIQIWIHSHSKLSIPLNYKLAKKWPLHPFIYFCIQFRFWKAKHNFVEWAQPRKYWRKTNEQNGRVSTFCVKLYSTEEFKYTPLWWERKKNVSQLVEIKKFLFSDEVGARGEEYRKGLEEVEKGPSLIGKGVYRFLKYNKCWTLPRDLLFFFLVCLTLF